MTSHNAHTDLTEGVAMLEARLTERLTKLEARLERLSRLAREYIGVVERHVDIVDRDQQYAFERLKNLELKLFPHLQEDITRLHDIIGDYHDKADQPLDRRKR